MWFYFLKFALERSYNCEKDYLQISEGIDDDKRHLGRYCGQNQPRRIRAEKGVLTVRFVTDGSTQNGGFKAAYHFVLKTTVKPTTEARATSGNNISLTLIVNTLYNLYQPPAEGLLYI